MVNYWREGRGDVSWRTISSFSQNDIPYSPPLLRKSLVRYNQTPCKGLFVSMKKEWVSGHKPQGSGRAYQSPEVEKARTINVSENLQKSLWSPIGQGIEMLDAISTETEVVEYFQARWSLDLIISIWRILQFAQTRIFICRSFRAHRKNIKSKLTIKVLWRKSPRRKNLGYCLSGRTILFKTCLMS